jgi:hypothetical protein
MFTSVPGFDTKIHKDLDLWPKMEQVALGATRVSFHVPSLSEQHRHRLNKYLMKYNDIWALGVLWPSLQIVPHWSSRSRHKSKSWSRSYSRDGSFAACDEGRIWPHINNTCLVDLRSSPSFWWVLRDEPISATENVSHGWKIETMQVFCWENHLWISRKLYSTPCSIMVRSLLVISSKFQLFLVEY